MTRKIRPAARLKALRLERRLTLADLSSRTGIPVSTLSKVENEKLSLTYDKLQALSTALGIDAGTLFTRDEAALQGAATGRRSILKKGDGKRIDTHLTSYLYLASELRNKAFIPLIAEISARSLTAYKEMVRHAGEEFTHVLEGSLELHTELYEPVALEAGESIYFDSGTPHAYIATGDGPCRVMIISSSSEGQLFEAVDRSRPLRHADEALPKARRTAARNKR